MTVDVSEFNAGLRALADNTKYLRTRQDVLRADADSLREDVDNAHVPFIETGFAPSQTVDSDTAVPLVLPYAAAGDMEISGNGLAILVPRTGIYLVSVSAVILGTNLYRLVVKNSQSALEPRVPLAENTIAASKTWAGSLSTAVVITDVAQSISLINRTQGAGSSFVTADSASDTRVTVMYVGQLGT